jgi:pyridinium-3,5-biscarboxylic acid mononucleotide sulfurtransferase
MARSLDAKKERLQRILQGFDALAVAFSGGADSSLLLALAREVLPDRLLALTAVSPIHSQQERGAALNFARSLDVRHRLVDSGEMALAEFRANPPNRCYICKKYLFDLLLTEARKRGIHTLAHGANCDDSADYRPGFKAARELGAVAPLMDAGMTKADIRDLSRQLGLDSWNKPAMACLASRIPYHTPITARALAMVEKAEMALVRLGFSGVRVRHHGDVARIEVAGQDLPRLVVPDLRDRVVEAFRDIGFVHISVDLEGYRQGSMNRSLSIEGHDPDSH